MDEVLGYDCDGEEVEEYRVLRFPFSDTVDNWEEVPNVDPRFYCAIRAKNNQVYLISVYDDYNKEAIRRYEKIAEREPIPTIIKDITEAEKYEVAFNGITSKCWYYDRDRNEIRKELELLVKNKGTIIMGLREDVKYMLDKEWEPQVPTQEEILKQAELQIKRGKSTGSVSLDRKSIKSLKDKEGDER